MAKQARVNGPTLQRMVTCTASAEEIWHSWDSDCEMFRSRTPTDFIASGAREERPTGPRSRLRRSPTPRTSSPDAEGREHVAAQERLAAAAGGDRPPCCCLRPSVASHACYVARVAEAITQRELRNDSGEIMRRLDQGEAFVVTRNGVPVGELIPLRRRRFVPRETVIATFVHAPTIDPARLREDLDRHVSQDIEPRA